MVKNVLSVLSRMCLSYIFVSSGIYQALNFDKAQVLLANRGVPLTEISLGLAIFLQIVGGLSILLGFKAKKGAWSLIVFVAAATWVFHFEVLDPVQSTHLMKNIAILGGLLQIAAHGSGAWSLKK